MLLNREYWINGCWILIALGLVGSFSDLAHCRDKSISRVPAFIETEPVARERDAVDDLCIWIHPTEPAESIIIGTDKLSGLITYDLEGKQIQHLEAGSMNNVDLRYNFLLEGKPKAILAATNRCAKTIDLFTIDQKRLLNKVGAIQLKHEPYGSCMYYSAVHETYYCFVTTKAGEIEQWAIRGGGSNHISGEMVRSVKLSSQAEGCVADDELGYLYISEEHVGVWKYYADPGLNDTWNQLICAAGPSDRISPDVEGIALYYKPNGTGYLIVSSQGSDSYIIFRREGNNEYLGNFAISGGTVDDVTHTDGIDVTNFNLGSKFPKGLFIAQDDQNFPGDTQNFKLVRWDEIADGLDQCLEVDTSWDPRKVGTKP